MNVVCGWNVANSILKKSFEEENYITPLKLNCMVYLLYSEYFYLTREKLFNEFFENTKYGPVVPSIYSKFGTLKNNVITRYAKDANDRIMFVRDDKFEECVSHIWKKYKNFSDDTILFYVESGIAVSKKQYGELLSDSDILQTEIYRNEFELKQAKSYEKKIN